MNLIKRLFKKQPIVLYFIVMLLNAYASTLPDNGIKYVNLFLAFGFGIHVLISAYEVTKEYNEELHEELRKQGTSVQEKIQEALDEQNLGKE